MQNLNSSLIKEIQYQAGDLFVRFKTNNKLYKYLNVPQGVFESFLLAPSVGRFFRQNIKNKFEMTKIEEEKGENND